MIATDNLPFSVVENIGFQHLVSNLEPRYRIKSEKYYQTELFPQTHEQVCSKIKQMLSKEFAGNYISFTTDCWSGPTELMMSLTAHFITKNWEKFNVLLNVKVTQGSHTGEYLALTFLELLEEWQLSKERVFMILRDSGANIVKGLNLINIPHLSCFAHSLQLVVEDGLKTQQAVVNVIANVRKIASHFNPSCKTKTLCHSG